MRESNNLVYMQKDTITKMVPLTEEEKAQAADDMAELKMKKDALEKERREANKDYQEQIKGINSSLKEQASMVQHGVMTSFFCDLYKDYNTEEMVWIAVETGEEVSRRPMTDEEKRPSLFIDTMVKKSTGKSLDA